MKPQQGPKCNRANQIEAKTILGTDITYLYYTNTTQALFRIRMKLHLSTEKTRVVIKNEDTMILLYTTKQDNMTVTGDPCHLLMNYSLISREILHVKHNGQY